MLLFAFFDRDLFNEKIYLNSYCQGFMTTIKYRPEIDGLRAVAVLSVLIYHAFPEYLPGGYVGVDIFFVISGFLITGILVEEFQQNHFSLWNFYQRRIRRIFPALLMIFLFGRASCAHMHIIRPPSRFFFGGAA